MMDHNVGTYVVSNTMMSIAKYDWLLRFDTDDIMLPDFITRVMKRAKEKDIIKCPYISFGPSMNHKYIKTQFARGVIFMAKKNI